MGSIQQLKEGCLCEKGSFDDPLFTTPHFFLSLIDMSSTYTYSALHYTLLSAQKKLLKKHPLNIGVKNSLHFLLSKLPSHRYDLVKVLCSRISHLEHLLTDNQRKMNTHVLKKIKQNAVVLISDCDLMVISALLFAKKKGKRFSVRIIETTSPFLSKEVNTLFKQHKIQTSSFLPISLPFAFKGADVVLLGCDGITPFSLYSSLGSSLLIFLARDHSTPVYICTLNLSFSSSFIPPKHTSNLPIFDTLNPQHITGVISESGIFSHSIFVENNLRNNIF